jgi:large subunit ribosomal protein L23
MSTPLVHQNTIIKPVVTEKSYSLASLDKYVFQVDPAASKYQIKKAIEDLFKVNVLSINTVKHAAELSVLNRTTHFFRSIKSYSVKKDRPSKFLRPKSQIENYT